MHVASLCILAAQSLYSIPPNQQAPPPPRNLSPKSRTDFPHFFLSWNSLAILGEQSLGDDVWVTSRGPTGDMICHTSPASPIAISMRFTYGGLVDWWICQLRLLKERLDSVFMKKLDRLESSLEDLDDLTNFECCVKLWTHFFSGWQL